MPPRRRRSPDETDGREDWLGADEPGRARPWAYEELLLGSAAERARVSELSRVESELETEHLEVTRLHEALDVHLAQIAKLDQMLEELKGGTTSRDASPRRTLPYTESESGNGGSHFYDARSRLLAHCEGFGVDSPDGPIGFVEGVRFVSRIDRPDLLEVRGGRFGRQHLLVPIEHVEEIRLSERLVVLRSAPVPERDALDDLGDRLRHALHLDHAAQ
jgi:hypothetical protein